MPQQSRVIYIPGIFTSPKLVNLQFKKAFTEMFPNRELIVVEKTYIYTQHNVLNDIVRQVLELIQDGKPTTLVGHSFGGIIAVAVYWQARKLGLDNISKIITVVSPHYMRKAPGIVDAKKSIEYKIQDTGDLAIYTFGARIDHVVPRKYTNYPGSVHANLLSTHSGFWLNPRKWRYRDVWNVMRD